MTRLWKAVLAVPLVAGLSGCGGDRAAREAPPADALALAKGNAAFALDLYARLREREGNLFFSPFSISAALAMTWAGARGQTAAQMARVLHFDLAPPQAHAAFQWLLGDLVTEQARRGCEVRLANALWAQKGFPFLKDFLGLVRKHYGARLEEADFAQNPEAARLAINHWAEDETRGKITDLVGPDVVGPLTRLVLANAIYFKADWARPFFQGATQPREFTLLDGTKVEVKMMEREGDVGHMAADGIQAVELPYAAKDLSMVVLLPDKQDGLPALEKMLTPEKLAGWLAALRKVHGLVVMVPRFRMTCELRLEETLRAMGMTDAFGLGTADFSGMDGGRDLFIGAALHKAFVDVNEKGTEAAAKTAAEMKSSTRMPEPTVFRADHPFLFLIRDTRSGSLLFLGRLVKPEE